MLKVKEEDRMSWEDVFNYPLIKDAHNDTAENAQSHPENDL